MIRVLAQDGTAIGPADLVPGDRQFSWPKVRALLGTNRLSMPDAATAREVTGYERGTITPFGSQRALPVYADEHLRGPLGLLPLANITAILMASPLLIVVASHRAARILPKS